MIRRPPRSTRTDTLFPFTTLFRSWRVSWAALCTASIWENPAKYTRHAPRIDAPMAAVRRWLKVALVLAVCEVLFDRSEEHTSELQSLMRISYAVFCLKKKKRQYQQ